MKFSIRFALLVFLLFWNQFATGQVLNDPYPVIPYPVSVIPSSGYFELNENTFLSVASHCLEPVAKQLSFLFQKEKNINIGTSVIIDTQPSVCFYLDPAITRQEEYKLVITSKKVSIISKNETGAFNAIQTMRQLISDKNQIPCCTINDYPQYAYRGFHLDVSRHFFSKEYILKIIDWLSFYKINKLQLHLTDDQGWRIQIDKYPLLTLTGAWRTFDKNDSACMELSKSNPDFVIDRRFIKVIDGQVNYGGFYTKDDIREIINYAAMHEIEVIPEIDMPGHMSAAIKSYPYLSCTGSTGWGKEFSLPACPCNKQMLDFAIDVWDEIADLFPSKYVHVGCDEVEKDNWKTSSSCQEFMKQKGMDSLNQIQDYFLEQISRHLETKGKIVIAWDDAIDGKIDSSLVMMYWRDWRKDSPELCAKNGNQIILTPWEPFYISGKHTDETFKMLYNYDPEAIGVPKVQNKVIGLQACVWTEEIPSEACFENHVFPRLQAFSEISWSKDKNWDSFIERLNPHLKLMDNYKINYRKPLFLK